MGLAVVCTWEWVLQQGSNPITDFSALIRMIWLHLRAELLGIFILCMLVGIGTAGTILTTCLVSASGHTVDTDLHGGRFKAAIAFVNNVMSALPHILRAAIYLSFGTSAMSIGICAVQLWNRGSPTDAVTQDINRSIVVAFVGSVIYSGKVWFRHRSETALRVELTGEPLPPLHHSKDDEQESTADARTSV